MTALVTAVRWDIVVQARNGFYWASAFLVLVVGGLLLAVPETARANPAVWVPAVIAINLQITTFFFVAGLMLLERDEGTLAALAVSPLSPGGYLAARMISLTTLAAVETVGVVWIAFDTSGDWILMMSGTAALGAIYTGFGAAMAARYASVNALLLPAAMVVTLLLLPLLPHFGLGPRWPFLLHPIEPALTLIRAGYGVAGDADLASGVAGSVAWSAIAFLWGRRRVGRLMCDTRAGGGR
jgi:fluoroquinolone transport system permease protein